MTEEQVSALWCAASLIESAREALDPDERLAYLDGAQHFIQAALETA